MNNKHMLLLITFLPLIIVSYISGYHTTNVVTMNNKHMLLVWGGLHNRAATTKLELFDIDENIWMEGKGEN